MLKKPTALPICVLSYYVFLGSKVQGVPLASNSPLPPCPPCRRPARLRPSCAAAATASFRCRRSVMMARIRLELRHEFRRRRLLRRRRHRRRIHRHFHRAPGVRLREVLPLVSLGESTRDSASLESVDPCSASLESVDSSDAPLSSSTAATTTVADRPPAASSQLFSSSDDSTPLESVDSPPAPPARQTRRRWSRSASLARTREESPSAVAASIARK